MEHWWNDTDRENWSTQKKAWPSVTMSTTNPTWTVSILHQYKHFIIKSVFV